MKKIDRNAHTREIIERLFLNKDFISQVKQSRDLAKIPAKGFSTFQQFYKYLEDEMDNKKGNYVSMHLSLNTYSQKYNLPLSLLYSVEAVIALGKNYEQFEPDRPKNLNREFNVTGAHIGLRTEDDRVVLDIFPGASQREIIDFIKAHWSLINEANKISEIKYGENLVVRNVSKRDKKEIYRLYKSGEIASTGVWNDGTKKEKHRPDCIRGIGGDYILKIIAEESKKEKSELRK